MSFMRFTVFVSRSWAAVLAGAALTVSAWAEVASRDNAHLAALSTLTTPPKVWGDGTWVSDGQVRSLYFEGLPYHGKPTRVYALVGIPRMPQGGTCPGIVLVHGGSGTAFKKWVTSWNEAGFAAIAIATEGQTDERDLTEGTPEDVDADPVRWQRHAHPGPWRTLIYGDHDEPLESQWMYHAVADTVLANSLLRSLPMVDATRVGVMGVSWGGIITSTVIGLDTRFAFAIPTYGCGGLLQANNQYSKALESNPQYASLWDPVLRLSRARMPTLWLTGLTDRAFPLTSQSASYHAVGGPYSVAVLPDMKHSHVEAWTRPDSYAFAQAVAEDGKPWGRMIRQVQGKGSAAAEFVCRKPVSSALLVHTTDMGYTGARAWHQTPAQLEVNGDLVRVSAPLPTGSTAFFFNLNAEGLTASSDFVELDTGVDDPSHSQ